MNIDDKIKEEIIKIGKKYSDIKKISLFGSRSRGDNCDRSDIDLAIWFCDEPNDNAISDLEDIETLLKIDITIMNNTFGDKFLQSVAKEEQVIYVIKFENKLDNFKKAVDKLRIVANSPFDDDDILRDSLIQRFEFCYELSWKTLGEYLRYNGLSRETMPRYIYKQAYEHNIIDNQDVWLSMIKDRNIASHEYDENYIVDVSRRIQRDYLKEFERLIKKLERDIK